MSNSYTGEKAHSRLKKAFDGIIDLPDDCLSYEFRLGLGSYDLDICYHNKDNLIINKKINSKSVYLVLKELFVQIPDKANLIKFKVCPDEAFTLTVEYLADFK